MSIHRFWTFSEANAKNKYLRCKFVRTYIHMVFGKKVGPRTISNLFLCRPSSISTCSISNNDCFDISLTVINFNSRRMYICVHTIKTYLALFPRRRTHNYLFVPSYNNLVRRWFVSCTWYNFQFRPTHKYLFVPSYKNLVRRWFVTYILYIFKLRRTHKYLFVPSYKNLVHRWFVICKLYCFQIFFTYVTITCISFQ